jgi:RNA polymerase sigma-70 factor (ECF subfamily)
MQSRGDQFNALWREHHRAVAKFVLRRLPEHEDPSDVVSEVFVTAWRRLGDLPTDRAKARPWLYRVAHKTIANRLRGSRRRVALETRICNERATPDGADPQGRYGAGTDTKAAALIRAFNGLSAPDREAIALVTWEDLTPAEAARVIGIAPARFRVRLHRAKGRLRDRASEAKGSGDAPEPPFPVRSTTEEVS